MERLNYLNRSGDFVLRDAQDTPGLYFPLVNEGGMISSVTPSLAGDCKTGQNTFLLAPASAETLHESRATRNFWVTPAGGLPWSVTGQSAPQQAARFGPNAESCTLTGGLLWQMTSRENAALGLLAEVLSFVPAGRQKAEIMQVRLTNTGAAPLELAPTAAIPLYGRSADNIRDHRHVTSLLHRLCCVPHGLDVAPTLTFDERGHRPGDVTYRVWGGDEEGRPPERFIPLVRDFVGAGSYDWPQALVRPASAHFAHAGDTAQGGEAVAALFFAPLTLAPGQTARYQIVLAIDDDPAPYLTPAAVEQALAETRAWWEAKAVQTVRAGDERFTAWMRWVAVQPTLRRICGCSFLPHHDYGRGGRGWRDLWQDSLALLLSEPDAVREDLLHYFAGVRIDGTNATIIGSRPGEFKADRNGIPRVWMDHGFWPLLTVALYLDETGDYGFLQESQPYFCDTLAWRGEGPHRPAPGRPHSGTVLEHLLVQSVTAFFDVGEHGHMRLRGADWNDGLDMAAQRGESVAFTAAYAVNFDTLAALLERLEGETLTLPAALAELLAADPTLYGDPASMQAALRGYCEAADASDETVPVDAAETAQRLRAMGNHLRAHIRAAEWVGDGAGQHWFNSYYDNSGRQVEGERGEMVRMMLTGQVFCLLSGTATDEQARQIVRAADWYLCHPARGGYCLNTDFDEVKLDMGRMFGFAYGHKENGAVFCHMAVMYAYALYSRGLAAAGYKVLDALFSQCVRFEQSGILPGIPEYFDDRGTGMYPYLTGAASWLLLTVQTQMFGVRGQGGDLLLEPKLAASQFAGGSAELVCVAAGRRLRVQYRNPLGLDYGSYQIAGIRCGETEWPGGGALARIARSALPAAPEGEPLSLQVLLAPMD